MHKSVYESEENPPVGFRLVRQRWRSTGTTFSLELSLELFIGQRHFYLQPMPLIIARLQ